MTWQTMLELSDGWEVFTPMGSGTALIITTPSYLGNSTLYVKLHKTGELKHFDSNDIRIGGSPTYGEDRIPPIPKEWESKTNLDFLNDDRFKKLGESGGKTIFVLKDVKDGPVMIYNHTEGKVYTSGLGLLCKDMDTLKVIFRLLGYELK